jgi:uncharacterized protein DUF6789
MHPEMQREGRGHAIGGGVLAGLIAGIVMSIAMIIMTLVNHGDVWLAMKHSATPFLHERAGRPGFDAGAVALGVLCHLGIAVIWGALFAAVFFGIPKGATVVAGIVYGIVVWLVMYYIVLPLVGMGREAASTPIGMAAVSHMFFGLVLALAFLPFQRTRPRAVPPVTRAPVAS